MREQFVRVAVPVPTLDLLTYRVPEDIDAPAVGARVVVPLGSRAVTGVVVDFCGTIEDAGTSEVRPIRQVLDSGAFIPPDVIALAQWTADYYAAGAGEAVTAVLPPGTRGERADGHKTIRIASITTAGLELLNGGHGAIAGHAGAVNGSNLTRRQTEALQVLAGRPHGMTSRALAELGVGPDALARLQKRGLVVFRRDRVDRDPFEAAAVPSPSADFTRRLTEGQQRAFDRLVLLAESSRFRVALLHGVTGSGKTEIYVRLARVMRDKGRTSLMLVPEIALTPVAAALLREAFADRVAIQHSGLSDGERHDQWQRIRRGDVDVVVGTRSAVFAPIDRLGLVVVDEEHDGSYKQEEAPRYNGRDVAILRAQRAGALIVLGSATPAIETYHHAVAGKYDRIVIDRRVLDRPLAAVRVVDMREEYAAGGPDVVLSRALADAIATRLDRGEQALVLLNRRGFSTAVFCRQCAGTMDCPNCSVSLVVHGQGPSRRARCHYCNYSSRVASVCPLCAAPYMEQAGFGTERVEAEIGTLWPKARVGRLDRDAIRRKGALASLLGRFRDRELDVLVGTQMIAKGHDFPNVTLVGVVSADVGLGLADFRASERTFQLLTQVAGRAGRGDRSGEAIIQTIYPDHYSIQLACLQDYPAFYERELEFRRAMRYPPFVSLMNAVVRAPTFSGAMDDANDLAERIRAADREAKQLRVLGPAPAPLGKLRGEYRVQILLKGTNRKAMRAALRGALAARPDLARRTTIDIDPVSVL